jgi:hypothetical protein
MPDSLASVSVEVRREGVNPGLKERDYFMLVLSSWRVPRGHEPRKKDGGIDLPLHEPETNREQAEGEVVHK